MKITLIGDSICLGYQQLVREKVGARAEVWAPEANCGHSLLHRENFSAWYLEARPDVVHFNAGIWDVVPPTGDLGPRFTVSAYVRNLRLIVRRLRAETKARVIFATTTPILFPLDATPKEMCRIDPLLQRFNAAAVRLMRESGVEVDDLYSVIVNAGVNDCLLDDKVHMTPRGNEVLSDAVVRFILG